MAKSSRSTDTVITSSRRSKIDSQAKDKITSSIMSTPSVPPGGLTQSTPPNPGSQPPTTSSRSSTTSNPPSSSSTTSAPPTSSTPPPPPPSSSSSSTPTPSSSSTPPPPPPTTSTTPPPPPPTTSTPPPSSTTTVVATATTTLPGTSSSTPTPTPTQQPSTGSDGLDQKAKVAIGVVVPIVAILILAVLGLFWWRKRKARQEEEAERRKEVEDYSYNPNADPTIPAVGLTGDNSYEMREDASTGYRGWGSTAAGSMGRKASTTMSGGVAAGPLSDGTGPTRSTAGETYVDGHSSEGEILGAMGPSAANNRGDMRRGPSNASSSYSAAGRSEGSDGGMYAGTGGAYYDQYGQGPYAENAHAQGGQAVIRDNPARRNTQIENSAHYPQQSAGIAQNF